MTALYRAPRVMESAEERSHREHSEALAATIARVWADYPQVEVWLERTRFSPDFRCAPFLIRSNLVDGLPPRGPAQGEPRR